VQKQQVVGDDTILFAIRTHRYRFMIQPSGTLETTYMNVTYIISTWNLTDWDYRMPRKSRNEVSMLSMETRRTHSGNRCSAPQVVSMAQESPSVRSKDMQNVNLNLHTARRFLTKTTASEAVSWNGNMPNGWKVECSLFQLTSSIVTVWLELQSSWRRIASYDWLLPCADKKFTPEVPGTTVRHL